MNILACCNQVRHAQANSAEAAAEAKESGLRRSMQGGM